MQTANTNLFTRDDTFFGICQGLGEDLGIYPDLIRLALVPCLFFFPVQTIAGYFAAGVVVLALRLIVPNPRIRTAEVAEPAQSPDEALPAA